MFVNHAITLALLAVAAVGAVSCIAGPEPGTPWPATDALGRALPLSDEVGAPKQDRWVGIFYFLWHDNAGGRNPNGDGPYDIGKILEAGPDAAKKPESPLWGPVGMYHYWGEPLYGYYRSDDPWVLRRHADLLSAAGVDTLIFDTTNAVTYTPTFLKLCEVFAQVRSEGGRAPHISFMVNTHAGATARRIYEDLYKKGLYRDLWFVWDGKPLMICDPKDADDELKAFFTLRKAHWPFEMINTPYAWHWEATYPQPYGYTVDPAKPEMVNVSVAQNLRVADGRVTNMSNGDARGRSFADGKMDLSPGSVNLGLNFQEQWKRVAELDPPFVMITGWNEWIAGRWGDPKGPLVFVDQFDQQYSRDIEPGRCSHGDNYYWQMVANIRKYKGAPPIPQASAPKTIDLEGGFDQWKSVAPEYVAPVADTKPRDHDGVTETHYVNRTGRNDVVSCKVTADASHVYFYARTREPITGWAYANWMWLLIRVSPEGKGSNPPAEWEGFQFIVNREVDGPGQTWLERCEGGWKWKKAAQLAYRTGSHELHLAIPRKALGLDGAQSGTALDFKWLDNAQSPGDPLDVYVSGDAAPIGRYRFRYIMR